jgi:hypothetical protein
VDTRTEEKTELQEAEPLDERILNKVEKLLYILSVRLLREKEEADAAKQ